jgi:predicted DNA-binding transcriptional regulator YafY
LLAAAASTEFDAEELRKTINTATSAREADTYRTVADALTSSRVVRIAYERAGSGEPVERDVEPLSLFAEKGGWYLMGWCRRSAAWRTFRLDRIRQIIVLDETCDATSRSQEHGAVTAFDTAGLPLATLVFQDAGDYVAREWPGSAVVGHGDAGALTVTVPFAGTDWVARAVVSWLGSVRVTEPPVVREAVAELAASLMNDPATGGAETG